MRRNGVRQKWEKRMRTLSRAIGNWLHPLIPVITLALVVTGASLFVLYGPPHAVSAPGNQPAWRFVFNLGAFIFFICCLLAILPMARHEVESDNAYVCGLVATAALIPTTVAEITTIAAYVAGQVDLPVSVSLLQTRLTALTELSLFVGMLSGLLAWGVWALFYRKLATPRYQNTSVYSHLCDGYTALKQTCSALADEAAARAHSSDPPPRGDQLMRISMIAQIDAQVRTVGLELGLEDPTPEERERGTKPGGTALRWVLGTGYTNLWSRLHAAEEALITVGTREYVVQGAMHDVQRLQQSAMPSAPQLLEVIRLALNVLSPRATEYLAHMLPVSREVAVVANGYSTAASSVVPSGPGATAVGLVPGAVATGDTVLVDRHAYGGWGISPDEQDARVALRQVRKTLNSFRDSRWEQLLRHRNRLLEAVIFTRVTAYVLIGFTILIGVPAPALLAAAIFYFVGALTGAFNRVRTIDTTTSGVEDYGLSSATLVQTTPFSGLAAIGGVLVTGLFAVAISKSQTTGAQTDLSAIFDLARSQYSIVTAAIFGLTPGLLINRLQQAADVQRSDLRSTMSTHTH
jgi:hypothetical protein